MNQVLSEEGSGLLHQVSGICFAESLCLLRVNNIHNQASLELFATCLKEDAADPALRRHSFECNVRLLPEIFNFGTPHCTEIAPSPLGTESCNFDIV